jgi:hypothetical protein
MNVRYRVALSEEERSQLQSLIRGGRSKARKLKRAQVLLAADAGSTDAEISANVGIGSATVYRIKQRVCVQGVIVVVVVVVVVIDQRSRRRRRERDGGRSTWS